VLSKANSNYKTKKSLKKGWYEGAILYLAPEKQGGLGNVCPFASTGCKTACLFTAGRGAMSNVRAGRQRKTELWFKDKPLFFNTLALELKALELKALKNDRQAFVRLNGTSDIDFSKFKVYGGLNVFEAFPNIQFYDYTKDLDKALNNRQANYHLTFSRSETNQPKVLIALRSKINVAIVFKTKALPKTWLGFEVLDGDSTDLRFEEGYQGKIIGLVAKGKAKRDLTGFVVNA
jgi:hypothetical protein